MDDHQVEGPHNLISKAFYLSNIDTPNPGIRTAGEDTQYRNNAGNIFTYRSSRPSAKNNQTEESQKAGQATLSSSKKFNTQTVGGRTYHNSHYTTRDQLFQDKSINSKDI